MRGRRAPKENRMYSSNVKGRWKRSTLCVLCAGGQRNVLCSTQQGKAMLCNGMMLAKYVDWNGLNEWSQCTLWNTFHSHCSASL